MDFSRLTSLPLHDPDAPEESEGTDRIREAVAVLDAINLGEMFSALPAGQSDRARHQTGIVLLEMLRQRLKDTLRDAES